MYRKRSDPGTGELDVRSVAFLRGLETQAENQVAVVDSLLHDKVQVAFVEIHETSLKGSVNPELIGNWGEANSRCQKLVKRNLADAPSSIRTGCGGF
jgi:hypothetical protein